MELSVLGPMTMRDGDREDVLPARLRTLLAVLACRHGRVASTDLLIDALWRERIPAAASRSLQVYVHRLRAALGDPGRVEHRPPGYRLVVPDGFLDADRFTGLAERGRALIADGRPDAGSALLRQALDLWRGAAYDGCDDLPGVREEIDRLTELRRVCAEERLRAELDLGRHAEAVGDLRALVSSHPYSEGPRALLMLAFYRLGRPSEALETFQDGRRLLAAELGLDPGPELRAMERAVLTQDPSLDLPAEPADPVRPRELPAGVTGFVGRAARTDRLTALLTPDAGAPGPRIAAVAGAAGVGKSALAIRVAHRVAPAYPDGQLYVNLHGHTAGSDPLEPADVLGRFLRALGDGTRLAGAEEAAARFRSLTADRRVLVVLDNAVDEAQVRPLLPAGPGCGVLVTGRRVLAAIDGAAHEHLDALPPSDATDLLGRLVGTDRAAAAPDAAARIARLCGDVPLALRIAGARLVVRPDLALAAFADRLAEDRGRLDELQYGDLAVRASLAASHRHGPEEARTLAHLGVFDGHTISVPMAAAAVGTSGRAAARDLDRLVEAQFLQPVAAERYEMHDLVRAYAREQAETLLTPKEHDAALHRVLHFYLASARDAARVLDPGAVFRTTAGAETRGEGVRPADQAAAMTWVEAEKDNLVAAVRQASASAATAGIAVGMAVALRQPLDMCFGAREHLDIGGLALAVAERAGDRVGCAQLHTDLGVACTFLGDDASAVAHQRAGLDLWRAAGDRAGEARCLNNLGLAYSVSGAWDEALRWTRASLDLRREMGDARGEALVLGNLGNVQVKLGRLDDAIASLEGALALHRGHADTRREGIALGNIAEAHLAAGRPDRAEAYFRASTGLLADVGDRVARAEFLWGLGDALRDQGAAGARAAWAESVQVLQEIGEMGAEEARDVLAAPRPEMPAALRRHR